MDNIKDFAISSVFMLVCSVSILFFALGYPALNNQQSVLIDNPAFNNTAQNLSILLGNYQTQQNININISTADTPQSSAEGLYLISTTATSRNLMSQLTESFVLLTTLLGNVFGLSGTQFIFITGSLISLFGLVLLYFVVKNLRWGN
ncbi:hypothetical protein LCGC14_0868790 [marine sediment metagenome]|uniref:Uncharacterized protein n=1 Tax=marine sediment metagenome TaxID=412755 RepID=A0A0F9SCC2_9ZZZZ